MTLRDWTDPRDGRHWKARPTLVLGALVLFGGCGEQGEGVEALPDEALLALGVEPLPDAAFLAVVEYFQASGHIWVEPVFVVEDRLIQKDPSSLPFIYQPGSFRPTELPSQVRSRLIELGMQPCRAGDDSVCPEAQGVVPRTLIGVGDVLSRSEGSVTTSVVLITRSPDILGQYASDVFSVQLTDGSEGWSVAARVVFSEN